MIKRLKIIGVLVVGAFALGQAGQIHAADANPPELMTYQGYLVDGNGDPLGNSAPANYDVVFRIYKAKQGGLAIWGEQQTVTVDKGYFSVLLGEGVSIEAAQNINTLSDAFKGVDISHRFIGITVSGLGGGVDVEIAPRLRLVTSPFAFTATRALRLTDDSGNSNFFKDSATSSLKLGAGSTPTLTLPEAGGASLDGKLTIDLAGNGIGLQINNGALSTEFGAENGSAFHFKTGLPVFWFQKGISVNGEIHTYNRDTIIGPSSNLDTYLKIASGADDSIHAKADKFAILGDEYWMETRFSSGQVDLVTSANKFKMNKALEVDGALQVTSAITTSGSLDVGGNITASGSLSIAGDLMTSGWIGRDAHHVGGLVGAYNNVGGSSSKTNPIYIIGSSYKPNEGDLGGMYGIGYSHPDASFITGNASEWGLYVAAAGTANAFISGYAPSGRSYIKNRKGGLGVGTDSPDSNAALTAVGDDASLGWGDWAKSIHVSSSSGSFGTISGPSGTFMGLHVNGLIYFGRWDIQDYYGYLSPNGWNNHSDVRLKEDIQPISSSLDRLEKVRGVNFKWKHKDQRSYGVIAQEIEKQFPEMISEDHDEMKGVAYDQLTPILLEGLKELRAEKDEQLARKDERINELEDRLAKLEELVAKIDQGQ